MKRSLLILLLFVFSVVVLTACSENGKDGAPAKQPLVEAAAADATDCPDGFGGTKFITGYDNNGDGKIDEIYSASISCNEEDDSLTLANLAAYDPKGCAGCHTAQSLATINSRHVKNNSLDATQSWVGADCLVCHTDGNTTFVAVGATSGLTCGTCHKEITEGKDGNAIHGTSTATVDTCISCHGDISSHAVQGHFAPFSTDIQGTFGTTAENAVTANFKSAHGLENGKSGSACAVCHSGEFVEKIVMKENPRTAVANADGVYTTSGGATYKIEKQWNYTIASGVTTGLWNGYSRKAEKLGLFKIEDNDNNTDPAKSVSKVITASIVKSKAKVDCKVCHDPHDATNQALATKPILDGKGAVVFSAEFLLCTTCHVANIDATPFTVNEKTKYEYALSSKYVSDSVVVANDVLPGVDSDFIAHHGDSLKGDGTVTTSIIDTHFAGTTYTKYAVTGEVVTVTGVDKLEYKGYNINAGDRNSCTSCHDAHQGSAFADATTAVDGKDVKARTIAENWATSGHAQFNDMAFVGRDYGSSCNRCHNGRAAVYSLAGDVAAKLNENTFGPGTGSVKGQTVACFTCHDSNEAVRTNASSKSWRILFANAPASVRQQLVKVGEGHTAKFEAATEIKPAWVLDNQTQKTLADGTKVDLTVLAKSSMTVAEFGEKNMVCLTCHAGRSTGEYIVEESKNPTGSAHYLDAVGTIKMNGPYNFPGKNYESQADTHANFAPISCGDCHDVKLHTFKVYANASGAVNASDLVAGDNLADTTCSTGRCHDGNALERTIKNEKGFKAAVEQLNAAVTAAGITKDSTTALIGAAYNANYFAKYDRAGWAHGMKYAKLILIDSMEALGGSYTGIAADYVGVRL